MPMNIEAPTKLAVGRVRFFGQHRREVNCSAFSPDGQTLLTAADDETRSRRLLWRTAGHRGLVKFCRFSRWPPGCQHLCDHTVCLWDVTRFKCLHVLRGHWLLGLNCAHLGPAGGNPSCLCYSAFGLLASGSWDKTIHIWKATTSSLLFQLKGHVTWVKSLAFSLNELRLASAGYSYTVKVWDCNTGECLETLKGLLHVAHASVFTPDGKLLVSGAADMAT
ncbi:WD repeat-containing protein 38 [Microtus ochrogaster]|uniref:WD repeat-containing protein 38 n=1 Tax=Microtus ochrogaster TaxID=79684 RepID=A0A8J6GZI8_MICOH|nr:WD repeat-containing protein 38 [Microtus ochrogaster]